MNFLIRRVDEARRLFWRDMTWARIIVALGSLAWAGHLLFDDYQFNRPIYQWMSIIAPQWAYGAAFLLVGVFQFVRAWLDYPIGSSPLSCLMAIANTGLWCCATLAMWYTLDPAPASNSGNMAVTVAQGLILMRVIAGRG